MDVNLYFSEAGRVTNLRGPEAERDWKANGSYRSFRQVASGGGGGRMLSSLSMAGKRARGGVVCCNANFEQKIYFVRCLHTFQVMKIPCEMFGHGCAKKGWILAKSNYRYLSVTFQ
jgi:hypothetical protein